MVNNVDQSLATRVEDWIKNQAKALNVEVTVHPDHATRDGDWLHVPVAVDQSGDAYDRASWLQSIEDAWDPTRFDGIRLALAPARPTHTNPYDTVGNLMKRQHQLLDRIDQNGTDMETAQRFHAIRQEWEQTLHEMERLYPSLKNRVV